MQKGLGLALLVALSLASFNISVVVKAQEPFTPVFVPNPCAVQIPVGYVDGENLICGTVEVPELHSDPTGKTIRLAVTVIKKAGGAPDPLVMFNGGPGSNILNFLPIMSSETAALINQNRDIVLMTERGTPGADPELRCPEIAAALEGHFGESLDQINAIKLEAYTSCRERLISEGVNLNAYNNPERAADVPMVMQALGYTEYNLWGVSGGGIMAQYVLRQHPEGVRTVMTDSGTFPTAYIGDVFFNIYDIVSNAYRRFFEACAADTMCSSTYPDLETVYWNTIQQLNDTPASVQITDPTTGETIDWMLTGDVVVSILANEFTNVEILPSVMFDIANGDYSYVLARVPGLYSNDADYADGLYESVVCSETSGLTQETAAKDTAYLQVVDALYDQIQFNIDLCKVWDVAPVAEGPVITSDVPILIMEGKFDSNKPPEFGAIVADNFTTSYLVEFADTAHGVFGACSLILMGEFMNDPYTAPDTSCVATETVFAAAGSALTFSEHTLPDIGVTAQLPDGWTEADKGVYVNPLDGTVLVIMAMPGDNVEDAVMAFASSVGLPTPEKLGDVPLGDNTWSVYQVIDGDTGSMIAAANVNGQIYLTGLQTTATGLEDAINNILQPVTASLTFAQ
ncbi:MAG: alpha/beta fold hydrolase [Chloroflexi bacterium]|nr:alpha/beta fold hydrolase [Chloroflexota bacterium]